VGATYYLINLWIAAAEERPTGTLEGWSASDIAEAAGWSSFPDIFVDALLECGWVEKSGDTYTLHAWEEHQPWVYHSVERSECGRLAALIKWEKARSALRIRNASDSQSTTDAECYAPSPIPIPIPIPTPYPSQLLLEGETFLDQWDTERTTVGNTPETLKEKEGKKREKESGVKKERIEREKEEEASSLVLSSFVISDKALTTLKARFPKLDVDQEWEDCKLWWGESKRGMQRPTMALLNWLKHAEARRPKEGDDRPYTGR
jgi:hypothetical protein